MPSVRIKSQTWCDEVDAKNKENKTSRPYYICIEHLTMRATGRRTASENNLTRSGEGLKERDSDQLKVRIARKQSNRHEVSVALTD